MKLLFFDKFYFYFIVNNIREKEKIKLAHIKKNNNNIIFCYSKLDIN